MDRANRRLVDGARHGWVRLSDGKSIVSMSKNGSADSFNKNQVKKNSTALKINHVNQA